MPKYATLRKPCAKKSWAQLFKNSQFFYFHFHINYTMKPIFFTTFMVAVMLFVGCNDPSPPPQTGFYTDLQTNVKPQIDSALELTITSYGVSLADIHILDTTGRNCNLPKC
jgi:hypothetical protein